MSPTSNSPRAVGAWALRATAYERIGRRMPTKTRSPSRISRDATATIISWGVYLFDTEVRRRRRPRLLDAKSVDVDALQVRRAVGRGQHPLAQPRFEAFDGA